MDMNNKVDDKISVYFLVNTISWYISICVHTGTVKRETNNLVYSTLTY